MSNAVETFEMSEGVVTFDHSTGVMRATWHNGFTETWSRRGYSIATKFKSFLLFTEQWDRYERA